MDKMDIKIERRPWYVRYRIHMAVAFCTLVAAVAAVVLSYSPKRQKVDSGTVVISTVSLDKFMEYIDVEGVVHPKLTLKVNARESGSVSRIVAGEGSMIKQGDTILVLENAELLRTVEDDRDEWEKYQISYREKDIEITQHTLNLQQQALKTDYELEKLRRNYALDEEEYHMGIKSKAQLDLSRDELRYRMENARLQRQSLSHDSTMSEIRRELLRNDMERQRKKYLRSLQRLSDLAVCAPIGGQLSYISVVPGQQIRSGESIAEIKVLDSFKIHSSINEYYIDRVSLGLPANVVYEGRRYPLKVSKVVPEVKERNFGVELAFTGQMPENVRIGKSFRIQIELGQSEDAVVIPRGDFFQTTGGRWIYKLNSDGTRAVRVPITIGRQNAAQYEIIDGLSPGDRVITSGYSSFGDVPQLSLVSTGK